MCFDVSGQMLWARVATLAMGTLVWIRHPSVNLRDVVQSLVGLDVIPTVGPTFVTLPPLCRAPHRAICFKQGRPKRKGTIGNSDWVERVQGIPGLDGPVWGRWRKNNVE